jgi:hypothetical protein
VKPVVASEVANGVPVVAALAEVVKEQFVGATLIAVAKVTETEVPEPMLQVPARIGATEAPCIACQ